MADLASEPVTGGPDQRLAVPHGQPSGWVITVYAIDRNPSGADAGTNPALSHQGATTCTVP